MSSQLCFRLKLILTALTLLYSGLSKAEDVVVNPITPGSLPALSPSQNINGTVFFPLYPRLNVTGGTGNNNFGAADVLAPLFGSTNGIVYTDIGGQMGKGKSNFLSLGFGVRDAVNDDVMWGGYAFIDRSKTDNTTGGNHWTVINPGVEFMTNNWDGRVNGYIPTGNKEVIHGTFFGDQVGRPDVEVFSGHNEFSRLFNKVDEIGPGVDVDAGYTFTSLRRFRLHGGGYFFKLSDTGNINGGEVGAEMPINNYAALQLDDSYDDVQKNTAVVSVRFTLGGIDKFANEPTVQDRILDPIYRHLGALGTSTGIPTHQDIVEIKGPGGSTKSVLEQSNIWFYSASSSTAFDPSAGLNNCTFEHPCKGPDFTQTNIDIINGLQSNANFYFNQGTYTFAPNPVIDLNSGQSMWGRTSNYSMPASSTSGFPTFVGQINSLGNNTLDSFALINNAGSQPIGIHVQNANNVLMNNLQIGQLNLQSGYATSIQLDNAHNITVQNSVIQALVNPTTATGATATILTANNSSVNFNNNMNTLSTTPVVTASTLLGISATRSNVTANGNTFNLSGGINGEQPFIVGISDTDSTITAGTMASPNTFTISNFRFANGFLGNSSPTDTGTVTLTNNTFTLNNPSSAIIFGINNLRGAGTLITANNNTFNLTGGVFLEGVQNTGTGSIVINNNTFNLNSDGFSIIGVISNFPNLVQGQGNTFTFSGAATTKNCSLNFTQTGPNIFNGCT